MRCGISTACFYPMYTEKSLETIARMGAQCVEIFFNARSELAPAYLRELRRIADVAGVAISSIHPYTSGMEPMLFFSQYARRFDEGLELYREFFEAAALLGAKLVVFHGHTRFGEMPVEEYCERFARVAEAASRHGTELCQENVERCAANNHSFFSEMRSLLPGAGFVLDIKQAVRAGEDVFKLVEAMGKSLRHIHISDHDFSTSCMLPGRGHFEFEKLLKQARNQGFDGDLIVEVYSGDFLNAGELLEGYQHIVDAVSTIHTGTAGKARGNAAFYKSQH